MNQTDLQDELRQRLRRLERAGPWEIALAGASAACAIGMLLSLLFSRQRFQIDMETSGAVFFAALLFLLLLAWLARDRAKRARRADFEAVSELIQRHLSKEQALRDPLTGVFNRAALEEVATSYFRRAEREGKPVALVLFDLNDFHNLNNRFGHLAGDSALVEFAETLNRSIRGSDMVARYGGDEFVLLLGETGRAGAEVVVARVEERLQVRNQNLAGDKPPLTFAAGAAEFQPGMNFTSLFREADLELLRRKAEQQGAAPAASHR